MSAVAPTDFPTPSPDELAEEFNGPAKALSDEELLQLLRVYFDEAQEAREGGENARDRNWALNWDAYWGRYDTTYKAEWQAREVLPEVANFVDRMAAGMRSTLVRGEDWHTISDPTDDTGLLGPMMNNFTKLLLAHSGRNATGQDIGFEATFADCVKCGALSAACASVTVQQGKVRVDAVDPREVFLDPKGRGLYRVRRYEIDRWQLAKFKDEKDADGKNLYHPKAIDALNAQINEEALEERRRSSGGLEEGGATTRRVPVTLKEYHCTILNRDGELVAENQLVIMANDTHIIRGPELNPFWHGRDWLIYMPPIQVPFSQYGRSYVEIFRDLANTFTELTNLLVDAAFASSISSHMVWLEALDDVSQIQNGIAPGVVITAAEEWPPGQDFIKEVRTGQFSPGLVTVWQGVKAEMREGAFTNETSLGQIPPKGDITATEIQASTAGSSALVSSVATDYDTRFLAPLLELVFWTGLQIYDPETDPALAAELGDDLSNMILSQRDELRETEFQFTAFGITAAVDRGQRLQKLLGLLQVIAQSEVLTAEFGRKHSISRLLEQLLRDFDIDPAGLEKSQDEIRADEQRQAQARALAMATQSQPPGQSGAAAAPDTPGGPLG